MSTNNLAVKSHRGKANNLYHKKYIYIYLVPSILVLSFTTLFPMLYNVFYSFTNKRLFGTVSLKFIWLSNYLDIITDSNFWHSVWISIVFCIFSVFFEMLIGFLIAYLFQIDFGAKKYLRTLIILPLVTTPVAVAYMFRLMLNPEAGVVNYLIGFFTGGYSPLWLASQTMALPTLILLDIWRATPFVFIIMCSGISALPKDEFEAARVDGANKLKMIRYIMLPLLKPIITVVVIFRIVDAIKVFDTIYALTGGGPGRATETLNLNIYRTTFLGGYFGNGCAMSMIMSLLIMVICVSILKKMKIGMLED